MMKEINYKTISIPNQRVLIETTRDLARLLKEEEYNEIIMIYKKVIDRVLN